MASLNEIRNLTSRQLTAMAPNDRDVLMMESLKEVVKDLAKLESMDAKLNKLDFIEGLVNDVKKVKGDVTEMGKKIETNKSEITAVKEGETQMRNEIEDLKIRLAIAEGAGTQVTVLEKKVDLMQKEMDEKMSYLTKAATYHQGMLESTDARFRATHLIIYGVPENEDTLGDNDKDRVIKIIEKTKALNGPVGDIKIKRLGVLSETQSWPRALHVTLTNHEQQVKILENAKNLKDESGCAKVYIRKDTHPTVRREQNRLRKREKEEKGKSENTNCTIRYDYKRRVLLRNNQVIDRFCPSFC